MLRVKIILIAMQKIAKTRKIRKAIIKIVDKNIVEMIFMKRAASKLLFFLV
jgi:hypothetical protein